VFNIVVRPTAVIDLRSYLWQTYLPICGKPLCQSKLDANCQCMFRIYRLRTSPVSIFRPMSSHAYLDASPPPYNGPREQLDKAVFHKTLKVLAVRVPPSKTSQFLKAQPLKGCVV